VGKGGRLIIMSVNEKKKNGAKGKRQEKREEPFCTCVKEWAHSQVKNQEEKIKGASGKI